MASWIPSAKPFHCAACEVEWRSLTPDTACWLCGTAGLPGEYRDEEDNVLPTIGSARWNPLLRDGAQ